MYYVRTTLDQLVQLVKLVQPDIPVTLVQLVQLVKLVQLDQQVTLVQLVQPDIQVTLGHGTYHIAIPGMVRT